MMKVSIAYFSTISQKGYKSEQLKSLVKKLEQNNIYYNCYSLDYSYKSIFTKKINFIFYSYIPLFINVLYNKLRLKYLYPPYYNYLLGEVLYSWIFSSKICKDESNIVILKNRPFSLVKKLKKKTNKFIIIDVDQQHPLYTKKLVELELKKYNISSNNIYTNNFAVNKYVASFKYADALIVYSQKQKDILIEFGIKNKILVFELGLENTNNKIFKNDLSDLSNKESIFISFANHTILKGTHRLIEIWLEMPKSFKLIIAGNIDNDFKEYLNKLGEFPDNIIFINQFNITDLNDYSLKFNLIGISLSMSESYSRVVSEYFELGIPVIVSEIIDRDVEKYNFGKIVNYDNKSQIKDAIYDLNDFNNYCIYRNNIINHKFPSYDNFSDNIIEFINNI